MSTSFPRIEAFIYLNKEIFKPGDTILGEITFINAINKTLFTQVFEERRKTN